MAVTMYPVVENWLTMALRLVPVFVKKLSKILTCANRVIAAMSRTNNESMARSVTTVPNAFAKSVLSYRLSTAQRANSPILGITKLTA